MQNEFSVYDGIKNGLKSEEFIFPKFFLANEMFQDVIEIKIGYSINIELPKNIKKIFNISLYPQGLFHAGSADITTDGFRIYTSILDGWNNAGEISSVLYVVNAKTEDYEEPWLHFLSYAYDHYRSGEYLTSIVMSEIALEAYVDKTLSRGYQKNGLDEDSISRFLTSTEMPIKVNPLMNNLYNIKLASSSAWNDWERKVLRWRNNIAHGTKINATKEESKLAFDNVVDAIFHFVEAIDN